MLERVGRILARFVLGGLILTATAWSVILFAMNSLFAERHVGILGSVPGPLVLPICVAASAAAIVAVAISSLPRLAVFTSVALLLACATAFWASGVEARRYGYDQPLPQPAEFQFWVKQTGGLGLRELTVDGTDWSFQFVRGDPARTECRGVLTAPQARSLLSSIEQLQAHLADQPRPCDADSGAFYDLAYTGSSGDWSGRLQSGCGDDFRYMSLGITMNDVDRDGLFNRRISCN